MARPSALKAVLYAPSHEGAVAGICPVEGSRNGRLSRRRPHGPALILDAQLTQMFVPKSENTDLRRRLVYKLT
jgi:hypothetical protein